MTAPDTTGWTEHRCTCDGDCTTGTLHAYPPPGTRVTVIASVETREVGDDNATPVPVAAGAQGTVEDYVTEWFDVHVKLDAGAEVWISPDNLTNAPTSGTVAA